MKATMSSFSERRFSVLIVKHLFSQMGPGWCLWNFGNFALRGPEPYSEYKGDRRLPAFEHHVFVCHNTRPEEAPRRSCGCNATTDLHAELQKLIKTAGLAGRVR